jgi:hypothetical protein
MGLYLAYVCRASLSNKEHDYGIIACMQDCSKCPSPISLGCLYHYGRDCKSAACETLAMSYVMACGKPYHAEL